LIEQLRIRQLRLVVEIAESSSLMEAAQRMNISQPAATKALQQIERVFDTKLVERSKSGSILTPAGQLVYARAKVILGNTRSVEHELRELRTGNVGRVTIGALPVALPALMPEALRALSRDYPGIVVRLIPGDSGFLLEMLRSEEIDLLVGRLWPGEDPTFEYVTLKSSRFVLVARSGHSIFDLAHPTIANAVNYSWILPPTGSHGRSAIDTLFQGAGAAAPHASVETTSYMITRELLKSSDMLAPLDTTSVATDLQSSALRVVDLKLDVALPPIGVMSLKRKIRTPTMDRVIRAVVEAAQVR